MLLVLLVVGLIVLAALFSGLTLGLMSLDTFELKRKAGLGNDDAREVLTIRQRGNQLLVTLLTGNVATISTLTVVLDSKFEGVIAGIMTTALITVFGEIIPQAFLARYALKVGARLVGFIKVVIFILYPISAPIAYLLDKVLGDELPTIYSKNELTRIIEDHSGKPGSGIDQDEVRIARGALSFGDRTIAQIMTPSNRAEMITAETVLTTAVIKRLKATGFSRIPVYHQKTPNDIGGILYLKDLIGVTLEKKTAGQLARPNVYFVKVNDNLDELLNAFLRTRRHLFVVIDEFSEVRGIVTIEDVLEEIIDREIADEFDQYDDLRKVAKRKKPSKTDLKT